MKARAAVLGLAWAMAGSLSAHAFQVPLPDAPSTEYPGFGTKKTALATDSLAPVKELGRQNLLFLAHINSKRPDPLDLFPREKMIGYPLDQPLVYSPKIILAAFDELCRKMPRDLYRILTAGEAFPDTLPLSDDEYLNWARLVETQSSRAIRWTMLSDYLDYYARQAHTDIRGYYYLAHEPEIEKKLQDWANLEPVVQERYSRWLADQCFTAFYQTRAACAAELRGAIAGSQVSAFYLTYRRFGDQAFSRLFEIVPEWRRSDVRWGGADPATLYLPLRSQASPDFEQTLQNIMGRIWRQGDWKIQFEYSPTAQVLLELQPGALPHAEMGLLPKVVLDANLPLTDGLSAFTIAHEFGHILGFPDCYVEYYDTANAEMVSYQIDTSDLMCSRKGSVKERHYGQLHDAYFH